MKVPGKAADCRAVVNLSGTASLIALWKRIRACTGERFVCLIKRKIVEMILKKASLEDAEQLHEMQRRSFLSCCKNIRTTETNPAAESLEKTIERASKGGLRLLLHYGRSGEKAGAIRVQRQRGRMLPHEAFMFCRNIRGIGMRSELYRR